MILGKKLVEIFSEDNGTVSSSRVAFLMWAVGILSVWMLTSIQSGSLQAIPDSVYTILGILMFGKVAQKYGEKR